MSLEREKRTADRLILSRLTGFYTLDPARTLLWHILGRAVAVADDQVLQIIKFFKRPRALRDVLGEFDLPVDVAEDLAEQLRAALLLRLSAQDEEMWIRQKYGKPLRGLSSPAVSLGSSARHPANLPPQLVLSRALTVLRLDHDDYLVTHPLAPPAHLTGRLWRLANKLERRSALPDAPRRRAPAARDEEVIAAVELLVAKRILWATHEEEHDALQQAFPSDPGVSLTITPIPGNQWRTKYLPYDLGGPRLDRGAGAIALLGSCQLMAVAEPLEYLATSEGWSLEVKGFLPNEPLTSRDWSLVVYSPIQLAANLYEAAAAGDLRRARVLAREISSRVNHAIAQIREATAAPIAVTAISAPGLWMVGDVQAVQLEALLAELNERIARDLQRSGRGFLVDEGSLPGDVGFRGVYWDDEFNAIPHHAPVSNWAFIDLPADSSDAAATRAELGRFEPPRERGQMDPAAGLAMVLWRSFLRVSETFPVEAIVFEPNDLLWRGRLEDRDEPYPGGGPHFYTADHYYFYAGVHEALSALRRAGVALACRSTCPTDLLRGRWQFRSALKNLVRLEDVRFVEGGDGRGGLSQLAEHLGVPEERILLVDLVSAAPRGFMGRVYRANRWGLRRYLLTSPELAHAREARVQDEMHGDVGVAPRKEPDPGAGSPSSDVSSEPPVSEAIDEVLRGRFRCDDSKLARFDDLRLLGLDSMGALDLMHRIEDRLGLLFGDSDFVATTAFSRRGLIHAAVAGSRSRRAGASVRPVGLHGGRTFEEWCAEDVGALLRQHALAPRVPWIFKIVRSTRPFDYEYLTWQHLFERAAGYARRYRALGVQDGGVVLLLLPQGSALIAAVVGAILGGFVPSICAYPNEKLSREMFAEWFGPLVERSEAALLVCEPPLEATIKHVLGARALAVPVDTQVPPPTTLAPEPERLGPHAPLLLQHSSGTTGLKKAVLLSHRAVLSQVWELSHALNGSDADRIVSWLPLYHDMGLVACLLFPLLCSVPTALISPFDWVQQPAMLFRQASEERASLCWLPNFAFLHTARRADETALNGCDLTTLRAVINCSETVTAAALDAFYERFSPYGLPFSALSSSYAMAEATFAVTQTPPGRPARRVTVMREDFYGKGIARRAPPDSPPEQTCVLVSSGRPLPRAAVEVVDADGAVVAEGRVGELRVQSDSLMREYHADPQETEKVMRGHHYMTGDLGFMLDGDLFVTGRKKDLVIVAGHNVYPHEVEETVSKLEGLYPGRTVAFGVFDEDEGTERLVVLAELREDLPAGTPADARAALEQKIREVARAVFGVVVSDVRLLPAHTLIKSTSGKISRGRNRQRYVEAGALEAITPP